MLRWFSSFVLALISLTYITSSVGAITLSKPFELEIPATTARIQGYAAPGAIVNISENGVVVASVTADIGGAFSAQITTTAGIHTFKTKYTDKNGLASQTNSSVLSMQPQQETLSEVFLSPTIALGSQPVVQRSSVVSVRGYTYPNKLVNISLDYGKNIFQTTSDDSGFYEYLIQTDGLLEGNHSVSTYTIQGVNLSDTSKQVLFTVQTSSEETTPDIVVTPDALPPPVTLIPQDGAVIDEDSITIYGESIPNAQINVYENGLPFGSIFSDDSGKWSFFYRARFTPVTFTFEVCKDGRCSVQSQAITVEFASFTRQCDQSVGLEQYRYWGIRANTELVLNLLSTFNGKVTIDWGDGSSETFSSDENSSIKYEKSYNSAGNYNGSITFTYGDCEDIRYFSVNVLTDEQEAQLWIFALLALSLLIGTYVSRKDKNENKQK